MSEEMRFLRWFRNRVNGIELEGCAAILDGEWLKMASILALRSFIFSIFSNPGLYFFCSYWNDVVGFETGALLLTRVQGVALSVPLVLVLQVTEIQLSDISL